MTAYPDPSRSPGLALWHVTTAWQRAIRAALAPYDLTHTQFVLLATLVSVSDRETVTQRDLSDLAGTDVMMTSQVLRHLETRGLIERHPHPTDRRARSLRPSEDGTALAHRANVTVEETDRRYFTPLGEGIDDFLAQLHTLERHHPRAVSDDLPPGGRTPADT